jgi:hypothetical protein
MQTASESGIRGTMKAPCKTPNSMEPEKLGNKISIIIRTADTDGKIVRKACLRLYRSANFPHCGAAKSVKMEMIMNTWPICTPLSPTELKNEGIKGRNSPRQE